VSAFSVLFLGPRLFKPGTLRVTMAFASLVAAGGFLALAVAPNVALYVVGFLFIAAVLSAMVPVTNTLIAGTSSRARRGTAFGIAGSAQAVSFMVGPTGAALFAAVSLDAGFAVLAVLLVVLAATIFVALREKAIRNGAVETA
jgi:MFS family permease